MAGVGGPPERAGSFPARSRPRNENSYKTTETRIFIDFVVTLEGEAASPGPRAPPPLTTSRERRDQWLTDNYDFLPSKFNRPPPTRRVLRLQTGPGVRPSSRLVAGLPSRRAIAIYDGFPRDGRNPPSRCDPRRRCGGVLPANGRGR